MSFLTALFYCILSIGGVTPECASSEEVLQGDSSELQACDDDSSATQANTGRSWFSASGVYGDISNGF